MRTRGLTYCTWLLVVKCIAPHEPSARAASLAMLTANEQFWSSGECVFRIPHQTIAGAQLTFCARISRRNCSIAGIMRSAEALASLRSSVAALGTSYVSCTVDSGAQTTFLDSLASPAHPLAAKYGASRLAATAERVRLFAVSTCSSVGLASPEYTASAALVSESELEEYGDGAVFLNRYAANATCRQSIPLAQSQRSLNASILSGSLRDMAVCDSGSDDPAYANCPANTNELFE